VSDPLRQTTNPRSIIFEPQRKAEKSREKQRKAEYFKQRDKEKRGFVNKGRIRFQVSGLSAPTR